jgi:hypothetical protein
MATIYGELAGMMSALRESVGDGPHLDAAYDKILSKVNDSRFPLRLLPPYQGASDDAYLSYQRALSNRFPRWIGESALP